MENEPKKDYRVLGLSIVYAVVATALFFYVSYQFHHRETEHQELCAQVTAVLVQVNAELQTHDPDVNLPPIPHYC